MRKARETLIKLTNLQMVDSPVNVCGDIHGQFYDLQELFEVGGEVPSSNYIFMGDFVDQSFHSVETFRLLLAINLRYPERITLIRGNHESRHVSMRCGFCDEWLRNYNCLVVWRCCRVLGLPAFVCCHRWQDFLRSWRSVTIYPNSGLLSHGPQAGGAPVGGPSVTFFGQTLEAN